MTREKEKHFIMIEVSVQQVENSNSKYIYAPGFRIFKATPKRRSSWWKILTYFF